MRKYKNRGKNTEQEYLWDNKGEWKRLCNRIENINGEKEKFQMKSA
jgi:hypothetical protein